MAEDFYSKKAIGDRIRKRLQPRKGVIERLKGVARLRRPSR